jgi:uncharacterized protein (TIGR02452 family)
MHSFYFQNMMPSPYGMMPSWGGFPAMQPNFYPPTFPSSFHAPGYFYTPMMSPSFPNWPQAYNCQPIATPPSGASSPKSSVSNPSLPKKVQKDEYAHLKTAIKIAIVVASAVHFALAGWAALTIAIPAVLLLGYWHYTDSPKAQVNLPTGVQLANHDKNNYEAHKNYLKKVWQQTDACVRQGYYTFNGQRINIPKSTNHVYQPVSFSQAMMELAHLRGRFQTDVDVIEDDIVNVAIQMGGDVVIMNPADLNHAGGGVTNGARALEEDECRRSSLQQNLKDARRANGQPLYPIHPSELGTVIHTRDVTFFRRSQRAHYAYVSNPAKISVGSVAGPDFRAPNGTNPARLGKKTPAEVRALIYPVLFNWLRTQALEGHTKIVPCAIASGVFEAPPEIVAGVFKELLDGPFYGVFKQVRFAIVDPDKKRFGAHNPRGNVKPYREVLKK